MFSNVYYLDPTQTVIDNPELLKILSLSTTITFSNYKNSITKTNQIFSYKFKYNDNYKKFNCTNQKSEFSKSIYKLSKSNINLILDYNFNQLINNLPNSIQTLIFDNDFNEPVDNLPNSVQNLILENLFNQPIDNLPNSIQNLWLGNIFNKSIDNLPNSIRNLQLGKYFNQSINNLPNSIQFNIYSWVNILTSQLTNYHYH